MECSPGLYSYFKAGDPGQSTIWFDPDITFPIERFPIEDSRIHTSYRPGSYLKWYGDLQLLKKLSLNKDEKNKKFAAALESYYQGRGVVIPSENNNQDGDGVDNEDYGNNGINHQQGEGAWSSQQHEDSLVALRNFQRHQQLMQPPNLQQAPLTDQNKALLQHKVKQYEFYLEQQRRMQYGGHRQSNEVVTMAPVPTMMMQQPPPPLQPPQPQPHHQQPIHPVQQVVRQPQLPIGSNRKIRNAAVPPIMMQQQPQQQPPQQQPPQHHLLYNGNHDNDALGAYPGFQQTQAVPSPHQTFPQAQTPFQFQPGVNNANVFVPNTLAPTAAIITNGDVVATYADYANGDTNPSYNSLATPAMTTINNGHLAITPATANGFSPLTQTSNPFQTPVALEYTQPNNNNNDNNHLNLQHHYLQHHHHQQQQQQQFLLQQQQNQNITAIRAQAASSYTQATSMCGNDARYNTPRMIGYASATTQQHSVREDALALQSRSQYQHSSSYTHYNGFNSSSSNSNNNEGYVNTAVGLIVDQETQRHIMAANALSVNDFKMYCVPTDWRDILGPQVDALLTVEAANAFINFYFGRIAIIKRNIMERKQMMRGQNYG